MRKLLSRRPSAGVIIGLLALVVALGGGAYAAKKATKVAYKGLSKHARLKLLPVGATNAGTNCDPTSTTFTTCTSVTINGPQGANARRVMLVFSGTFDSATATQARGECRLQLDNNALNGTTIKVEPRNHPAPNTDFGDGYGINIVTTPQGGQHTYSVACNETSPAAR